MMYHYKEEKSTCWPFGHMKHLVYVMHADKGMKDDGVSGHEKVPHVQAWCTSTNQLISQRWMMI